MAYCLSVASDESSGSENMRHNSDATSIVNDGLGGGERFGDGEWWAGERGLNQDSTVDKELEKEVSADIELEESWEEYDPTKFGSDVIASNAVGQPSARASSSVALPLTASYDPITSNLLLPSRSQRSFSNLNLEDPYGTNVNFGFDF